jgi:dienelactone hydrolase
MKYLNTISYYIGLASISVLFLVACTSEASEPVPTPSVSEEYLKIFNYDQEAPLGYEEGSVTETDGIQIYTISYASPMGDKVPAYLVIPPGKGPFPSIIFLHCGHNAQCTKSEFMYEATEFAKLGAASLLIDGPLLRMSDAEFDPKEMFIYSVLDIQRGVDLLISHSDISSSNIGYVGHSYGATVGAILSGIEKRIKAYVLMAGHTQVSLTLNAPSLEPLDAIHYLGHAAPSAVFFQAANQDRFVSPEVAQSCFDITSEPKRIAFYETDHDFNSQARQDRIAWLIEQLGLN